MRWAPWLQFSVNGTEIKLKVPRHNARSPMETDYPKRRYTLDWRIFEKYRMGKDGWRGCSLIARAWDFNGAWFIGSRAEVSMYANIITPSEVNEGLSFFHPRAFESGIASFMTYLYGNDISQYKKGVQKWFAPMNWQPLLLHPCIAVQFDAVENAEVAGDRTERYLFFPLSDHHLLKVEFSISRNNVWIGSNSDPERDTSKWINNAPMEQLASDIINTLQITLSPEAKQQQEKALAGLADTALVKEFSPIKWGNASNEIVK
ncbi:MAG TPA: hypothetical protein VN030_10490 [Cellvibrio sp.]|nr:hypothetical protein [Cellvibrio sp.]